MKLADVLSQITYEGDSSLKIGEDGTLVSANRTIPYTNSCRRKTESNRKRMQMVRKCTVKIKFQSNVKGTYYIDWVTW